MIKFGHEKLFKCTKYLLCIYEEIGCIVNYNDGYVVAMTTAIIISSIKHSIISAS